MRKVGSFCLHYRRGGIILLYMIIYCILFSMLESRQVYEYHVVHMPLDDMIPFCGAFIIPYMLWFPYILVTVLFILFAETKGEYYRLISNLMIGMSIFLVVSYVYPNMQELRPLVLDDASVFTPIVRWLYATDTPTNVLPSIHVFNSLACHMAIAHSMQLKKYPVISVSSLVLCITIILATMFLKQHSVIDVALGSAMAMLGYVIFYTPQEVKVGQLAYAEGGKSLPRR